jgi:cytochrome c553
MRKLLIASALVCATTVLASAQSLRERMAPCLDCHGNRGQSDNPDVPSLGAQPAPYTLIQLYLFREQRRKAEPMAEPSKDLSDDDLRQFSDAIAKLPAPRPAKDGVDVARMQRAYALIEQHRCSFCHTLNLSGRNNVPRLAAQREDYLAKALREYKSNARVGYEPIMLVVVNPLNDADIADLAYAISRMP